tara:strand:- start:69 stop:296 length:228 start_codon:yes stop_codon:yes gene_type:complete
LDGIKGLPKRQPFLFEYHPLYSLTLSPWTPAYADVDGKSKRKGRRDGAKCAEALSIFGTILILRRRDSAVSKEGL